MTKLVKQAGFGEHLATRHVQKLLVQKMSVSMVEELVQINQLQDTPSKEEGGSFSFQTNRNTVCKYNQTGFCKHGEKCFKYHENKICQSKGCKDRMCLLIHQTLCNFLAHRGK